MRWRMTMFKYVHQFGSIHHGLRRSVFGGWCSRVLLESKTSSFNDLPSIVKINTKFGMQACMHSMPGCCVSNDWITSTNSHSSPGCGMRWISVIVMNVSLSSVVRSIGSLQYQHVHHCFSIKVYRSKLAWSHPNSMRAPLQRPPPQKKSDTSMFHIQNPLFGETMTNLETLRGKWRRKVDSRQTNLFVGGEALCQASLPSAGDVRRLQCWRDPTPVEVGQQFGSCRWLQSQDLLKDRGEQKLNQWFWRDFIPDHLIWDGKIHYSLLQSLSILGWILFLPNLKIWKHSLRRILEILGLQLAVWKLWKKQILVWNGGDKDAPKLYYTPQN